MIYVTYMGSLSLCQPHTVISRNPKYFFGAKISIRFLLPNFFSRLVRFSIGEKSLPYVFEAARKKFPYFLRRLEKVSILFEAARKKIHYFEAARKSSLRS